VERFDLNRVKLFKTALNLGLIDEDYNFPLAGPDYDSLAREVTVEYLRKYVGNLYIRRCNESRLSIRIEDSDEMFDAVNKVSDIFFYPHHTKMARTGELSITKEMSYRTANSYTSIRGDKTFLYIDFGESYYGAPVRDIINAVRFIEDWRNFVKEVNNYILPNKDSILDTLAFMRSLSARSTPNERYHLQNDYYTKLRMISNLLDVVRTSNNENIQGLQNRLRLCALTNLERSRVIKEYSGIATDSYLIETYDFISGKTDNLPLYVYEYNDVLDCHDRKVIYVDHSQIPGYADRLIMVPPEPFRHSKPWMWVSMGLDVNDITYKEVENDEHQY
jgi:hypothetical protein